MQMQQPRHKVKHQTLLAGDRLVALLLWPLPFMQRVWPLRFVAFADFGASSCDHCTERFPICSCFCLSVSLPFLLVGTVQILRPSLTSNHLARYAFLVTSPSLRIQALPVQSD
jgi:hypothetical protein